jgi:DNA-binding NarL/FixJ family response regulator
MNTTVHGGKFFSPRLLDKIHMEETKTRTHYKNTGDKIDTLSSRQLEIFQLIGQGHSTREIAECLKLSVKTVEVHRENIKDKLGAETSSQLGHLAATWWAGQLKPGSPT